MLNNTPLNRKEFEELLDLTKELLKHNYTISSDCYQITKELYLDLSRLFILINLETGFTKPVIIDTINGKLYYSVYNENENKN